jgi:hypothetical protein
MEVANDLTEEDVERIKHEQPMEVIWQLDGATITFQRCADVFYCTDCTMKIDAAWGAVQSAKLYALLNKMAYQLAMALRGLS